MVSLEAEVSHADLKEIISLKFCGSFFLSRYIPCQSIQDDIYRDWCDDGAKGVCQWQCSECALESDKPVLLPYRDHLDVSCVFLPDRYRYRKVSE